VFFDVSTSNLSSLGPFTVNTTTGEFSSSSPQITVAFSPSSGVTEFVGINTSSTNSASYFDSVGFDFGTFQSFGTGEWSVTPSSGSVVPEPGSLSLFVLGGVALAGYGWRRRWRIA
jgi:hypothetical protein